MKATITLEQDMKAGDILEIEITLAPQREQPLLDRIIRSMMLRHGSTMVPLHTCEDLVIEFGDRTEPVLSFGMRCGWIRSDQSRNPPRYYLTPEGVSYGLNLPRK